MVAELQHAPCGFLRLGENGGILHVNRMLADMTGYLPEDLIGQKFDMLLSGGARVFCQTHFFPLLRLKGGVEEIYFGLKAKDTESVPVLVNAIKRELDDSSVVYDLVLVRMSLRNKYEDELLRARKEAEEATRLKEIALEAQRKVEAELRVHSERLKIATDVSGIAVGEIDMVGDTIQLSQEAARIFGLGDNAVTLPRAVVHDTFHADELELFWKQLRQAQDPNGQGIFALEHRIIHPNGNIRWVSARKQIHFDRSTDPPRPVKGVLVIQDITPRKELEAELRIAHQRKDEFIATLAHELRNPLATVQSGLQVLAFDDLEKELLDKTRVMMTRQVGLMIRLVDDLMDLNRISRGKVELRTELLGLQEVIATAVDAVTPAARIKDHQMQVDVPAGNWLINGDRHRMVQVVSNLLSNAVKYTPHGGQLRISLERKDGSAVVRVKDNGIGIATTELPMVFKLFAQLESGASVGSSGLGIGLNIVKRLVEMHGGHVEAHSDGPGKGSEFCFSVPLVTSGTHEPVPDREQRTLPSMRILIVDDNEDAAVSLALILRRNGHEVHVAHGGHEAVIKVADLLPDVVFMDIAMPGMNGYEACMNIRRSETGRDVRIIALSGSSGQGMMTMAKKAGFDTHLMKPIPPEILDDVLAEVAGS